MVAKNAQKKWFKVVGKHGMYGLQKVPPEERTTAVCLAAMERQTSAWYFRCIPEETRKDPVLWASAFSKQVCGWGDVPEGVKTPELCSEALAEWPLALRFVPDGMKTPEMCAEAFARDARVAVFVPEEMRTEKMRKAVSDLQAEADAVMKGLSPAPDEGVAEGCAAGGHVKVKSIAFLPPGSRYPRWGELPEEVQAQDEYAGEEDIIVTEWGEPCGCPDWQFQTFRHAELPDGEDGDEEFDPELYDWDKGVDYAWNKVKSYGSMFDWGKGFGQVCWKRIRALEWGGEEEQANAPCGLWAELKGFGMFPLRAGDLWNAYGRSEGGSNSIDDLYEEKVPLLRDALRWANPWMGVGQAEVLAHLALDDLGDQETDLDEWFADELGADAWNRQQLYSAWLAEERSGLAMTISRKDAKGTDREQFFEEGLKWGMIVCASHYGDFEETTGEEMNADVYDDWSEFSIAGAVKGHFNANIDVDDDENDDD